MLEFVCGRDGVEGKRNWNCERRIIFYNLKYSFGQVGVQLCVSCIKHTSLLLYLNSGHTYLSASYFVCRKLGGMREFVTRVADIAMLLGLWETTQFRVKIISDHVITVLMQGIDVNVFYRSHELLLLQKNYSNNFFGYTKCNL